jgi:hypothetical protein
MNASGGSMASGGSGGTHVDISDASVTNGACPTLSPACGGNLLGTWHMRFDNCLFGTINSCAGTSYSIPPESTWGLTYTFGADGTFSAMVSGDFIDTVRYPPACLYSDAGAVQACADFNRTLKASYSAIGDAGVTSFGTTIKTFNVDCSSDTDGTCVCVQHVAYSTYGVTGTYTTSGTKLTLIASGWTGLADSGPPDAGVNGPIDYCVSGNALSLLSDVVSDPSSSHDKPTVLTR